jgi:tRNA A-37 threonylcarbamoyl transferase component Bud32
MNRPALDHRASWKPLKESGRIGVYKALFGDRDVIIKEYRFRGWLDRLSFIRKQRVVRKFYAARGLSQLSVPPLLFTELDKRAGRLCYGFVEGEDFRQLPWRDQDDAISIDLMAQSADLLAQLHGAGWIHGDFKFGNLLYSANKKSVYLLDVEAVRHSRSRDRRARDLARFLLNSLEVSVEESALRAFWERYAGTEVGVTVAAHKVRKHLRELLRRHQQKYGRSANLASLSFL